MENTYFFIIILIILLCIYYIHSSSEEENFANYKNNDNNDLLTLTPYQRCNILGVKKFMIRDLRTKLWLIPGQQEGFNKFLPGKFGIPLIMSDNPSEYLPLRIVANPNDYLLASYNGDGIRTVSNPYTKYFIIQVFIYEGYNVLGYIHESETQLYLFIDDNGNILSKSDPAKASIIEIIEI
jgi:hypothetical protein